MSIKEFKNTGTRDVANETLSRKAIRLLPVELHYIAYRKLVFLDNACSLKDLIQWRSLRFEKLKGNREGQMSIRINDQYRICFTWINGDAYQVEIIDYHK